MQWVSEGEIGGILVYVLVFPFWAALRGHCLPLKEGLVAPELPWGCGRGSTDALLRWGLPENRCGQTPRNNDQIDCRHVHSSTGRAGYLRIFLSIKINSFKFKFIQFMVIKVWECNTYFCTYKVSGILLHRQVLQMYLQKMHWGDEPIDAERWVHERSMLTALQDNEHLDSSLSRDMWLVKVFFHSVVCHFFPFPWSFVNKSF